MRWLSKHGPGVEHMTVKLHAHDPPDEALETFKTGFVGLLAQLPRLKHLVFRAGQGFMNPQQDLYCLAHFPKLQSLLLDVVSEETWEAATTESLSCLTSLNSLNLTIFGLGDQPLVLSPKFSRLTQLRSLSLSRRGQKHTMSIGPLVSVLTGMSGLTQLELNDMLPFLPADLARLSQLQRLSMGLFQFSGPPWSMPASFVSCRNLSHISLGQLSQESTNWWWGVCSSLQALPGLRSLQCCMTDLSEVPSDAWAFGSQLSSLEMLDCELDTLPPALCSSTSLVKLVLRGNMLDKIPAGPYLEHLEELDISGNWIRSLPYALSNATRLRKLVIEEELQELEWWDEKELRALLPACCSMTLSSSL